jgi:uncharacterized protein YbjQ (UPF0145 family)
MMHPDGSSRHPFALRIPISTTESVAGMRTVAYVGLAQGSSVRSAAISDDVIASMKSALGGEIEEYTKILAECREQCLDRMIDHAQAMGANGVIGVRFCTAEITDGVAELMVYGTAVRLEPI